MNDLAQWLRHWERGSIGRPKQYDEAADEIERLRGWCDALAVQRDRERDCRERAVQILSGIHALLYPPPITTADGRTMVFRPQSPDPHVILQELSDRIRAVPDKLREVTPSQPSITLTGADSAAFADALINPPAPGDRLKAGVVTKPGS